MVVALPTGSGKTVIFSELARLATRPVLVLAHRSELVAQAADKLGRAIGDPKLVGIEQGSSHAQAPSKAVVASLRSLHPKRLTALRKRFDFGLVIYDECHHAAADDNRRVLEGLGCFGPDWTGTLLGFTATPSRADGKPLQDIFEEMVYHQPLLQMIHDGFLASLRGFRVETAADLRMVGPAGQDLDVEALAEAVDIESRNALVARSIQELARDRRTIAFCVNIAHATHLARTLNQMGIRTGIVHGKLAKTDRAQVLQDFRQGHLQAITNVGVLTEGFDDPEVSCIAMARPTRSEGLYAQCVGRGTRLFSGKTDCMVLDFVDLSDLSLVALPTLAGLPGALDLQGTDLAEAEQRLGQLFFKYPGFELPPGAITLAEVQDRAAAFDPLSMAVDPEVMAISQNRWESLGSHGLAIHFFRTPKTERQGKLSTLVVLRRGRGAKKWHVLMDGKKMATFSKLEIAVEASDYEIERLGRTAARTAHPSAQWRATPPPADLIDRLATHKSTTPVSNWGEAVRLLGLQKTRLHRPEYRQP
jgi:superfamily II DNA or RNA helicase